MDSNNNKPYVYKVYHPSNMQEEMTDERRLYLLEKQLIIQKRKKKKKIICSVLFFSIMFVVCFYLYKNYFRPVEIDERIDKNSIHYATDLYYSDGRYYDKYLDENQKRFYLDFFNSIKDVKVELKVDCRDYGYSSSTICGGMVGLLQNIVLMEHPDLFWYRYSSYSWSDNGGYVTINNNYVTTNKVYLYFVERRLLRKIDELSKEFDKLSNDKEKVEAVYTWLGETTIYSTIMTRRSGTAWSALLDDDSVCAGFAAASQLLFQRLDIESVLVVGSLSGIGHAWNFVELDDGYYWYDSTVAGSTGVDSKYFYSGLLFKNHQDYGVEVLNLDEYNFGFKYSNREF